MDAVLDFFKTNIYAHFAITGFLVGMVARILVPGPDPMGIIKTTLLGIAGSLLSGYLIKTYNIAVPLPTPYDYYVCSLMGAILVLFPFKLVKNIG